MIRKPNILILSAFMFSVMFTSCVEEFVIEDKDFESKLVVNEFFENDTPWSVDVSSSSNIFDNDSKNEKITFAKVKVYDQNDEYLYDLFHQGDGIYGNGDFGPSPKRGYSIKVSATGYKAVTAKSFVPEKSTLIINNFSIIPNEFRDDVEVDFEIEDKSMLESYYVWEVISLKDEDGGSSSVVKPQLSDTWFNELSNPDDLVNVDREILGGGSFGDGTYQGTYSSLTGNRRINFVKKYSEIDSEELVSSTEQSVGEVYFADLDDPSIGDPNEVVIHIDPTEDDTSANGDGGSKDAVSYELRVMSISKELYDYYSSLEDHFQNLNSISHSNQAPNGVYSNISNGLGIFAGFSESVIQF